jgi:uncharacterized protein (DUF885 family)
MRGLQGEGMDMLGTGMQFDRRQILASMLATAATIPSRALAKAASAPSTHFAADLDRYAQDILRLSPESATSLGLDKGANLAFKSKLSDLSPSGNAAWIRQLKTMLSELGAVDRKALSPADQIRYDTVKYAATSGIEGDRFFYGGGANGFYSRAVPYVVSQQDGTFSNLPEFLNSQHLIANAADAEAYVARVAAMAMALDQESERIASDAAKGVMPPSFIAKNALGQLAAYRKTPAAEQGLVASIAERTAKLGLKGEWSTQTAKLIEQTIYPALDRQIAAFAKATANAPDTAGVHRLPDGEAYYRWSLRLGTTTEMTPDEIHRVGLEQNEAIKARIDTILKAQGMTKGSVGERMQALTRDPKQIFPNTDEGRAALIASLNQSVADARALLLRFSHLGLKAPLMIKRVPADIQDGAPLGYMNFASLDGSRPAIYYINLKSTSLWPKYQLATLTTHEGIPGHTWQGAYLAEHHDEIPLIFSEMGFNAFIEGWALYAEQACDELGLFDKDPMSRIGYLQGQQYRACRLVVDTGIHAKRWTREQAIQFMVRETGRGTDSMTAEVDRYCAWPGQACGYKIGHNKILGERERVKAALGDRFDLAGFNDAVVKTGGVPLSILPTAIDQYIASVKA